MKTITKVENEKTAFREEYLIPLMNLIRLVFVQMNRINDLDIYKQIDAYMRTSCVRAGMDSGLWKDLNKGWKQVYNSVDMSDIEIGEKTDDIMLHWIADIYTYWQWKYCESSKEISIRCNAKQLSQLYYPLHETSIPTACEKLQNRFFDGKVQGNYHEQN